MSEPERRPNVESGRAHTAAAEAFARRAREEPAVDGLFLFGSTARDEASGLGSDVDFLAVVDDDSKRVAEQKLREFAYDVMLEFGPVVEVHVLSRSEFDRRCEHGHPFVRRILREGNRMTDPGPVRKQVRQARRALEDATGARDADLSDAVVVNRLYYACFHAAQAILYDRGTNRNHTVASFRCSAPRSSSPGTHPAIRDGS